MKTILRGEIWRVRFDLAERSEIGKSRPALITQNDIGNLSANTTIVAAITGRIKELAARTATAVCRAFCPVRADEPLAQRRRP